MNYLVNYLLLLILTDFMDFLPNRVYKSFGLTETISKKNLNFITLNEAQNFGFKFLFILLLLE